jgi:C-terminal processing protease CtpA/Prc
MVAAASLCGCAEDPFDFGQPRSCEIPDQNAWVYALMERYYLWEDELPVVDPLDYADPGELVVDVRHELDHWSRVSDKGKTDALFQEGKFVGLGFRSERDVLGRLVIASVHAGSPAARAGMERGQIIAKIGGFTIAQIDEESRWGDVYGEDVPGVAVSLDLQTREGEERRLELIKDWIAIETVPLFEVLQVGGRPVGYFVFATFVDTAPPALDEAFTAFREAGVRDVVVDLRYNGGGRIAVARHLMDLLVGDVADGEVGYQVRYSDALAAEDTDRELSRLEASIVAPRRIVFVTTATTLSASELVINGVRRFADVRMVGETTGGKPVGSKQWDFCEQIISPITFRLLDGEGNGDYFDGLPPDCTAPDDLAHPLGDPAEASLRQALALVETGACTRLDPGTDAGSAGGFGGPGRADAPLRPYGPELLADEL